jgi:hypothetical protein
VQRLRDKAEALEKVSSVPFEIECNECLAANELNTSRDPSMMLQQQ